MLNALTIDIEDYYQVSAFESVVKFEDWDRYESRVERNTHRILDLLDEHKTKATFFVLGWIVERQPKLIKAIHDRGHEVASHGYSHRRVYTQTLAQFSEETKRSKRSIEDVIGQAVLGYRAASYSITAKSLWALDVLWEEGFLYDSSIFAIHHDLYGIPHSNRFPHRIDNNGNAKIWEFPPSTLRFGKVNIPISGGGYLRLFPYWFIRWGIQHINGKEKQPAIVYLHPWEIDPKQPRIRASLLSKFRHYHNLEKTEGILCRLMMDFKFVPLKNLLPSMMSTDPRGVSRSPQLAGEGSLAGHR